jgi:hypothetical protein
MRGTFIGLVVLASLLDLRLLAQVPASDARSLQGAWHVAQVDIAGPTPRSITNHNPGMILITAKHFALVVEAGDKPRPTERATTYEELRAVMDPFLAFAGAYEISNGVLTVRLTVHKSPALMGPGAFITYSYKLEGDTLTLVGTGSHLGPRTDPFTWKLTRLD